MIVLVSVLMTQLAAGSRLSEPATDTILDPQDVGQRKVDRLFRAMEKGTFATNVSPGSPDRLTSAEIPFLLDHAQKF